MQEAKAKWFMYLKVYNWIQPDTEHIYGLLKKAKQRATARSLAGLSQCNFIKPSITPFPGELDSFLPSANVKEQSWYQSKKNFLAWKLFCLIDWNFHAIRQIFFGKIVHIPASRKLIKAPPPSRRKSNAQTDRDEGSSPGNHYEIVIWKVGDLG